ncbi:hypothetical protein FACS1894153_4160 [Bacteroidia bacterium]|nr:hypothetical protein FACS1894153_4160 [Bacteroidia bacterium]
MKNLGNLENLNKIVVQDDIDANSVVKEILTTAAVGKNYNVTFYSLENSTKAGGSL